MKTESEIRNRNSKQIRTPKFKNRIGATMVCLLLADASLDSRVQAQTLFIPEGNPAISMDDFLGNGSSIAVDSDGQVYVADSINHVIRKYYPDGSPASVLGHINHGGRVDGTAAQARFYTPFSLCYDGAGGILVLDNSTFVRRIDVATLTISTIANLASGADGTHMYDVTLGTFQNSGTLSNLRVGDIAVQSPGVFYVSASDSLGVIQYLLRCTGPNVQAVATSRTPVASTGMAGTRGLAIDRDGNVFMPFPVLQGSATVEYIFRFPGGGVNGVTHHCAPIGKVNNMSAGRTNRLYYFTSLNPSFYVVSSTSSNTSLGTLTVLPTYPACPQQEVKDAAVTPGGDLLAVNYRSYNGACNLCSPYGKVDRFSAIEPAVGNAAGDIIAPTITLTSPTNGLTLNGPITLSATAADNSGAVTVQFRVNDRDFGAPILGAPFGIVLNPTNLPAGNLIIHAIARDAGGNSTTSGRIRVRNRVGSPNLEGEIFAGDAALNNYPVGVAVDAAGDVYVGDSTRIIRLSPLGELKQIHGSTNAAIVDGDAATVRFANLRGLGTDSAGRIVAMDDSDSGGCYLRRLDPATGFTTTLFQLDAQTNEIALSDGYVLPAGVMIANGGPDQLWGWWDSRDVAGSPDGDLVVTLGNLIGWDFFDPVYPYHFLTRLRANENVLLAYSADSWFPDSKPRAVAVAPNGTIFASFQTDVIYRRDSLFALAPEFPSGGTNSVRRFCSGIAEVDHLAVDAASRVYVPCALSSTNPARVSVVSSVQSNVVCFSLQQNLLNQLQDLAIDGEGNVYVVCTEWRTYDSLLRSVARVSSIS